MSKIKIKITVFFLRNNNKDRCDELNVSVEVLITRIVLYKSFSSYPKSPHLISLNNKRYDTKRCILIFKRMVSFNLAFMSLKSSYEWPVNYVFIIFFVWVGYMNCLHTFRKESCPIKIWKPILTRSMHFDLSKGF